MGKLNKLLHMGRIILNNTRYKRARERYNMIPGHVLLLLEKTDKESEQIIEWLGSCYLGETAVVVLNEKKTAASYPTESFSKVNRELSRSQFIISDQNLPQYFSKKTGQIYIRLLREEQTSHPSDRALLMSSEGMQLQQDLLSADYILEGSHIKEIPFRSLLDKIWRGKMIRWEEWQNGISQILSGKQLQKADYGKKNVMIFAGELKQNGITASLMNLLSNIDLSEINYILCFSVTTPADEKKSFDRISDQVEIMCLDKRGYSLGEYIFRQIFFYWNIKTRKTIRLIDAFFERQYQKTMGNIEFDAVVNFTGYDTDMIRLLSYANHNIIFVHSNMVQENRINHIQHMQTLREYYPKYSAVAVVSEDILEATRSIGGRSTRYYVVENIHDSAGIITRSEQPLCLDDVQKISIDKKELISLVESDCDMIMNIGRFSAEKNQANLIDAFYQYQKKYPLSCLVIIGGYGKLYQKLLKQVKRLKLQKKVILIYHMNNPMPLLKRADLFVMSSLYEGLGLAILEADTLHVPVISTNCTGAKGFMEKHGGTLVSTDAESIYQGMISWKKGEVRTLSVDYDRRNETCVSQFENMIQEVIRD